jgi:ribA/ribD-fused uncharacterized protein
VNTPVITDVETLRAALTTGWQARYLFFWRHTSKGSHLGPHVLSQWWPVIFELDGARYSSAEQYMMAEKARLFGDEDARRQIMEASDPGKAKALGRLVADFDAPVWEKHRFDIVVRANIAKFGQHEALRRYLRETGDKVLVEASPVDAIWGVGLAADDASASDPRHWPGLNLLGFALMETRRRLS